MAEPFTVTIDGVDYDYDAVDMADAVNKARAIKEHLGRMGGQAAQAQPPAQRRLPGGAGAIDFMMNANPEQRQSIFDLIGQGAGTTAGIAVGGMGGPAAPITTPAGGAAGNTLGKILARIVGPMIGGQGEMPGAGEMAVDAAIGAAGPVAGTVLRGGARTLSGLRQKDFRAVRAAMEKWTTSGSEADAAALTNLTQRMGLTEREFFDIIRSGMRRAMGSEPVQAIAETTTELGVRAGLSRAGTAGETARRGLTAGAAGAVLPITGEPITSALLAAGVSEAVLGRAVPRLLASERFAPPFARWAFKAGEQRPAEAAGSLLALATEHGLTGEALQAVKEVARNLRMGRPPTPETAPETVPQQRDRLSNRGASLLPLFNSGSNRWHDPTTGHFVPTPETEDGQQ